MYVEQKLPDLTDFQHIDVLKEKRELTESIKYAGYIQNALLPRQETIKKLLKDHFIYFLPRDIVSGDFYWINKKKSEILIVVADCTGHGVPGAFMSILGISFLNEIVNRDCYTSTGSILNQLREYVMKALQQTGKENEQKDGIDMAICKIDQHTNKMEFSGAFNPVYIVKKSNLLEIHGDKMPIGIAADEEVSFTTHTVSLDKGDMIYLFSDGFVDQFGGPEGKKFKYKPFRKLLVNISELPAYKQKEVLDLEYHEWKGDQPQLDDILIMGFKYI